CILLIAGGLGWYLKDHIYPHFDHAFVKESDFSTTYDSPKLLADFQYLTRMIEHVHPAIGAITDKATYERRKAEIVSQLTRPMTRVEFYRLIGSLNSEYRDGHTLAVSP